MAKLNKLIPERTDTVSRESLLVISDLIAWLNINKSDVLWEAIKVNGQKEVRCALNELETHCELWR